MNQSHSIVEPAVHRNFGNTFQHQNGPNQLQHTNNYHHNNTRQQYHHRNTGQHHQHRNPSQHYQPRSFQRSSISSIPYLKENCLGCELNNKYLRELVMQHDGTLENCPFIGPLYINSNSPREQLL